MPRYRQPYYEPRPYYYKRRRFTWVKGCLLVVGSTIGFLIVITIISALQPYFSLIGPILLVLLIFLVVAATVWVIFYLYGMLQDQLKKKDQRDFIRVPNNERLAVRERKTRKLDMLEEETPVKLARLVDMPRNRAYTHIEEDRSLLQSPALPKPTPPAIVHFANIKGSIRPGQVLLGVRPSDQVLQIGEWNDIKTLLVLGAMASGKTTTMVEKTCEAVQGGAFAVICDPHAHKPDSLYHRVAPLAHFLFPGTVFAVTHEEILSNIVLVNEELERRIRGASYTRPLVLVVDEWNRLQRDETVARQLMIVAEKLGQEGRDFGVYGIFGAQRITHNVDLRKSVVSAIVHRIDQTEAKLVIPQQYAKYAAELPNGMSFVRNANGMTERLQQVLINSRDVELIASESSMQHSSFQTPRKTQDLRTNKQAFYQTAPNVSKQYERPLEQRLDRFVPADQTVFQLPKNAVSTKSNVSEPLRQEIIKLAKSGMSRRKIKDKLGLHGARYEIVRRVLDEVGM